MSLFRKLFDYDVKELKRFEKLANDIEALDEEFQSLSDEELKNKTVEFKDRLKNGSTLDDMFSFWVDLLFIMVIQQK